MKIPFPFIVVLGAILSGDAQARLSKSEPKALLQQPDQKTGLNSVQTNDENRISFSVDLRVGFDQALQCAPALDLRDKKFKEADALVWHARMLVLFEYNLSSCSTEFKAEYQKIAEEFEARQSEILTNCIGLLEEQFCKITALTPHSLRDEFVQKFLSRYITDNLKGSRAIDELEKFLNRIGLNRYYPILGSSHVRLTIRINELPDKEREHFAKQMWNNEAILRKLIFAPAPRSTDFSNRFSAWKAMSLVATELEPRLSEGGLVNNANDRKPAR